MKNAQGGGMMKQVMQMQKRLKQAQKELEKEIVTGSSGKGAILVKMTGSQKCTGVILDKEKIADIPVKKLEKLFENSMLGLATPSNCIHTHNAGLSVLRVIRDS